MTLPRPEDIVITPQGAQFMGRHFPCSIGRGGMSRSKREGDGATPVGIHRIVGCLYRADRIARPCDWALKIGLRDLWSDDPRDEDYNLMVRTPYAHSHEKLRRADPLYDLVLITNWNWPYAERGRGSAIFIHQWRRPGYATEGCVAFSCADLRWITARISHETRLIVRDAKSYP